MTKAELNWHTLQYAQYKYHEVFHQIFLGLQKDNYKSYPACVNCVQSPYCGLLCYGNSKTSKHGNFIVTNQLNNYVDRKFGHSWRTLNLCSHSIDNCAEFSAINKFIESCNKCIIGCDIRKRVNNNHIDTLIDAGEILLSSSYRPRTLEFIERCDYCKQLYGQEIF